MTQDRKATAVRGDSETLYLSASTRVTRVTPAGARGSLIIKQPLGTGATERVRRERAHLERLVGVQGVITPIVDHAMGESRLVFPDPGCNALATVLETRPLGPNEVLRLALALANILCELHRRGIVHKDINPANIVVGSGPLEVFLIDFDVASNFGDERLEKSQLSELSGTLPYMAPEQTGRTGRLLDWRADLYSLGTTLYAALIGKPPFGSGDPLQIVHDHLARIPLAPAAVDARVPLNLSRIIMRLLEKEPDDRYQSAEGLVFDLTRAYELALTADERPLTLGERDFPARLRPPAQLFGRDRELAKLRDWFDELAIGGRATVLVGGAPGVGKSALLDEMRGWVTAAGGCFAAAGFDPFHQDGESDALRQSVRALLRLLLAEPEAELLVLRERLGAELGPNATLAAAVLPEVTHLLQIDPCAVVQADGADALSMAARLQQITQQILRGVARSGRPVVLVIDDLQWASRAALDVLDAIHLDAELHGVLVLGSYRHTEVDTDHPLRALIERWQRLNAPARELHVEPLSDGAIAALLQEILRLPADRSGALAADIRQLTAGNPFDTLELIDALRRDGILHLESSGWQWDAARIHGYLEGRNVGMLVAQRLDSLAPATAALLDTLSCLGGAVPIARLAISADVSADEAAAFVAQAVNAGLLVMERATETVHFRHERVHQAVLARQVAIDRAVLLLTVARRLAAVPAHETCAAEPYLQVAEDVRETGEAARVIGLFRGAVAQGRLNASWPQMERYAHAALQLLARHPDAVADARALLDLELRLCTDRHAALYGLGRLAEADDVYAALVARCADPLRVAEATWSQISSLTHRDRPQDAIALAVDLLAKLGLAPPATPEALQVAIGAGATGMYEWLEGTTEAEDLARPECTDAHMMTVARTLMRTIPPAFFTGHPVLGWLIVEAARLWREHGPAAALVGPLSHATFLTSVIRNDFRGGHDIVRRVLNVAQARGYELDGAQARFIYALSCAHWLHPLELGVSEARVARDVLMRGGELHFGSAAYYALLPNLMDCARSLEELEKEATAAVAYCRRIGNDQAGAAFLAYRQFARCLRGSTTGLDSFNDASFEESTHLQQLAANPVAYLNYRVVRAVGALVAGNADLMAEHIGAAVPHMAVIHSVYLSSTAWLLRGMALAHRARKAQAAERTELLAELETVRTWFTARSVDAPGNFQHLVHLLDAERAWVVDDFRGAVTSYDAAYRAASTQWRPWHRGVILEQAARFRAMHGIECAAAWLLQRARSEYDSWGADAKTATLAPAPEDEIPLPEGRTLRDRLTSAGTHRSGSLRGGEIDLLAILKAAQQLQTETDPDRLVDSVSTVLSALSGATSVRLMLWSEELKDWFVSVPGEDGARREIAFAQAVAESLLPSSAFRYAQRTREPLVVDDALTDDRFARDPYFQGLQRCSLLVVPVLSRGVLKAMLVLENRVAQAVFAAQRLDGVMLIAGQLATSLDNALLSVSIERRVAQRVEHLDKDNERLVRLSNTDPLTGLANRRLMAVTLAEMIKVAAHACQPLSAAMIDVDHFKLYNDRYGHQAGDECLANVAAAVRECARDTDLVARYGGEEFVLLLPNTDLDAARRVLERVRANVAARAYAHERSSHGVVTLSIGVASLVPTDDADAERLLHSADERLYEAKQQGRNRVAP